MTHKSAREQQKLKGNRKIKAAANDHKRTFFSCFFCAWIECAEENFTKTQKNVKKEKKERAFFVNFHNSIEKPRKFLRNSCKTF